MTKIYHTPRRARGYALALLASLSLAGCKARHLQAHQLSQYQSLTEHTVANILAHTDSLMKRHHTDTDEYEAITWVIYPDTLHLDSLTLYPFPQPLTPQASTSLPRQGLWIRRHRTTHSEALSTHREQQHEVRQHTSSDSLTRQHSTLTKGHASARSRRWGWRTWLTIGLGCALFALGWRLGRWVRFRYLCPR